MRLKSTAHKKAKTSHMPNPTRVGPKSVDHPFEVKGYMKGGSKKSKAKGHGKKYSGKKHSK